MTRASNPSRTTVNNLGHSGAFRNIPEWRWHPEKGAGTGAEK